MYILIFISSIRDFVIANLGENNRTVRHPSRGVMDVVATEDKTEDDKTKEEANQLSMCV